MVAHSIDDTILTVVSRNWHTLDALTIPIYVTESKRKIPQKTQRPNTLVKFLGVLDTLRQFCSSKG